jgi:hypothetical protein
MTYCSIDNGISGAAVILSELAGAAPVSMTVMPVQAKKRGNQVDIEALWMWLEPYVSDDLTVVVEKPNNAQTPSTAASMADSFGVVRAMLALKRIRHVFISPQSWQKAMLPNCQTGQTKNYALTVAKQLWPQEDFLATPRSKVPHPGIVDALLIGEHARRLKL